MDVLSRVAAYIDANGLLVPGGRLVLGVSGGADSLCAMDCLNRLGYKIVVAHLDHQLRRGAWREAERVLALARDRQLPAVVERKDVRAYAGHGRSLEEAARLVRYDFLARVAREHKLDAIATGHTADDQVETILMHLLRGAGPSGLAGMGPSTDLSGWIDLADSHGLRLVRPLLETSREETQSYCRDHGLEPIADPSNRSLSFFRNRIRLELLPTLAQYNPSIKEVILRTGRLMRAEADFVAAATDQAWERTVRKAGPHALALDISRFSELPLAVRRSVIRRAAAELLPGVRDFGFEPVERAVSFIGLAPTGRREALPGELEILSAGDEAIVRRNATPVLLPRYPQLTSRRRRKVQVPGRLKLAAGWSLQVELADLTEDLRRVIEASDSFAIAVDCGFADELSIGPPEPGNRLRPFGMMGTSKISDILIDSHVPQIVRERWPILSARGVPIWVAGLRAAEETRLIAAGGKVVTIRLMRPESEKR